MKFVFVFIALLLFTQNTLASISLSATRVIYTEGKKEISLNITNHGQKPVLIQNWIDDGNMQATPDALKVPFIITPPIMRVNANQGQTLRISALDNNFPRDRESVFWVNVLEIPSKNKTPENMLQMAFRTRIKLFYRPAKLSGKPEDAAEKLIWRQISPAQLEATNNSPWNVSVAEVTAGKWSAPGELVPALGKKIFSAKEKYSLPLEGMVTWSFINDYGALRQVNGTLSR